MSTIRVIAGTAKGKRLKLVPGDSTRPITDRVKENLFNIIGGDIVDATMLDLFAGTGGVGIEALSRGASFVRFNDNDKNAVSTVESNLKIANVESRAEVMYRNAFALLQGRIDRQFDYVYIAPPQYKEMWMQGLKDLDANIGWLSEDAWVVVQIHPREYEKLALKNLFEFDQRKYGATLLVFYDRGIDETDEDQEEDQDED